MSSEYGDDGHFFEKLKEGELQEGAVYRGLAERIGYKALEDLTGLPNEIFGRKAAAYGVEPTPEDSTMPTYEGGYS